MVLCNEELAKKSPNKPAWIHGTAMRSEPTMYPWREEVNPQAGIDCAKDVYSQAGITNPRKELDMAEVYVPFLGTSQCGWKTSASAMWAMAGNSLTAVRPHSTKTATFLGTARAAYSPQPDRRFRHDSLRGSCAASARHGGRSSEVPNAKKALGHAYGGGAQFFSMWIVGSDKP
ncbi:MAG: hypothetical protein R3E61_10760 [Pseudomonadales bacterium]